MRRMLLAGLIALGIAGCNAGPPTPIYVGHVADRSRWHGSADPAELGLRLALAEVDKDGGILAEGIAGRPIQIRHTDTRGDLDAYESEAVRLVTINKCVALFGGVTAKEVEKLDRAQVPLLTFYGYPVVGASNMVYYLGMMPTRQGEVLARALAEDGPVERVTILLDERRADLASLVGAFRQTWKTVAKKEATVVRFGKDVKWEADLPEMAARMPQTVVFAGDAVDFNAWHKACSAQFPEVRLVYAGDDGAQRAFDLGSVAKTSVLLVTAFPVDPSNQKAAAFRKAYQDAFQTEPDVLAALAYDGFRLFAEALKRTAPINTQERLREELQKTKDFDGVTGTLTFTAERQTQRPLNVVRWQNGKLTAVKTFAP